MLLSLKNKQEKRRDVCVTKNQINFGKIIGRVGVFRENKVIKLMSTC